LKRIFILRAKEWVNDETDPMRTVIICTLYEILNGGPKKKKTKQGSSEHSV